MGLAKVQKDMATIGASPVYFCKELPARTLFRKVNTTNFKQTTSDAYIEVAPYQGVLHIIDKKICDFSMVEGFYCLNSEPSTYERGKYYFAIDQNRLVVDTFPLSGKQVYFINLRPMNDAKIIPPMPLSYTNTDGEYEVSLLASFDIEIANPIELFRNIAKNSASEHYLTDALINSISSLLLKHITNRLAKCAEENCTPEDIKANPSVLLYDLGKRLTALNGVGLAVTDIRFETIEFNPIRLTESVQPDIEIIAILEDEPAEETAINNEVSTDGEIQTSVNENTTKFLDDDVEEDEADIQERNESNTRQNAKKSEIPAMTMTEKRVAQEEAIVQNISQGTFQSLSNNETSNMNAHDDVFFEIEHIEPKELARNADRRSKQSIDRNAPRVPPQSIQSATADSSYPLPESMSSQARRIIKEEGLKIQERIIDEDEKNAETQEDVNSASNKQETNSANATRTESYNNTQQSQQKTEFFDITTQQQTPPQYNPQPFQTAQYNPQPQCPPYIQPQYPAYPQSQYPPQTATQTESLIEGLDLSYMNSQQNKNTMPNQYGFPFTYKEWLCPICKNEAEGNVCGFCGYRRETTPPAPALPTNHTQAMWRCTTCGNVNQLKFCSNCGTPKPIVTEHRCRNCGYKSEGQNSPKFCPECGNKWT